jgi:hypothetical protein
MKRLAVLATVACLWGCALPGTGRAGLITYTETATGSGSLGGTAFTDAMVTVTGTGDTANVTSSGGVFSNFITVTVTVAGIAGTATFTDSIRVFDVPVATGAGFEDFTLMGDILGTISSPPFDTYDLKSAVGPVTNTADSFGLNTAYPTTDGNFILNTIDNGTTTFTATTGTPEPASLTLLGLGVAGVAGYACRRRR